IALAAIPPEDGGGIQVTVAGATPRLCLTRDLDSAKLTLGQKTVVVVPATSAPGTPSCEGLTLHLLSSNPSGLAGFVVKRIADVSATFVARRMTISARDITL